MAGGGWQGAGSGGVGGEGEGGEGRIDWKGRLGFVAMVVNAAPLEEVHGGACSGGRMSREDERAGWRGGGDTIVRSLPCSRRRTSTSWARRLQDGAAWPTRCRSSSDAARRRRALMVEGRRRRRVGGEERVAAAEGPKGTVARAMTATRRTFGVGVALALALGLEPLLQLLLHRSHGGAPVVIRRARQEWPNQRLLMRLFSSPSSAFVNLEFFTSFCPSAISRRSG